MTVSFQNFMRIFSVIEKMLSESRKNSVITVILRVLVIGIGGIIRRFVVFRVEELCF